jgi:3-hydroxyisobutyrate dehydrogenase
MDARHLGFIGLGNMGGPMAGRLLDAGYRLTVYDTRADAVKPLAGRGAAAARSAAEVASQAETVLVSLPTPSVVRQVALGPGGVHEGGKVKTFVDLSTTGARVAREVAAALAAKSIAAVDSPVSGGVAGAVKGTLAVMVSCPRETFERLAPALANFGKLFHVGEQPGLGQTMKLANNLLSAAALAVTGEALVYGVKCGLDPKTMMDVINAGSGRNTATEDKIPRQVLTRRFAHGFTTGLMHKDVRLCVEEAAACGAPMRVGSALRELWARAEEELGPERDLTEIVRMLERAAGVEVRPAS